ncbi:ATP-dependent RNA helicase suv3 [Coprinopsis sp. MPI-PUGE-AT-0042]|nr:ATP-dependent RNA helicase suv3 [Coprinopsis sp. MPI-PUGE-AT-0042]
MSAGSIRSLCMRCRTSPLSSSPTDSWLTSLSRTSYLPRRFYHPREGQSQPRRHFEGKKPHRDSSEKGKFQWAQPPRRIIRRREVYAPPAEIPPTEALEYFERNVETWAQNVEMQDKLLSFGIPPDELDKLLHAFVEAVSSKSLSTPECQQAYDLHRFSQPLHIRQSLNVIYSTVFYSWATEPEQRTTLVQKYQVSPAVIDDMAALAKATDRRYIAEDYPETRRVHRKVIMHVGPTNSGKTYHALRALAAAKRGVYAGPLRLLAHEIWERLNLGQIKPAGAEEEGFQSIDAEHINDELPFIDAIKQQGDPRYARLTNMVTGEEQKIVHPTSAGLLSATVEMLSPRQQYDVAVVDEIQMITDPQRGSGWTNAVLGLQAKELHLCGEETAIPVVQALLEGTNDELVIKRYERLTPLVIEEKSLEGDLSKVRKGDCVVTFSRGSIFALKRAIEKAAGLRCAVVYGRLPPEIRSEQAALFNNPDSGYDVLIGSDAIGMGLNLKIRRVIFEAVAKFSGQAEQILSVSQVKQIAGRAGRFGLHEEPGGYATTLNEADLSYLRESVKAPFQALPFARIAYDRETFSKLIPVLPPGSSTATVVHAHHYVGRLPSRVRYQDSDFEMDTTFEFIDEFASALSASERVMHLNAPVAWRDPQVVEMMRVFLVQARDNLFVDLPSSLESTRFMETMERAEKVIESEGTARANLDDLSIMESFHKVLVLYIWLSFRAPILYPQYTTATKLKERLEKVLEWSLEGMSNTRDLKQSRKPEQKVYNGQQPKKAKIQHLTSKREMRNAVLQVNRDREFGNADAIARKATAASA